MVIKTLSYKNEKGVKDNHARYLLQQEDDITFHMSQR